jgi:hypothetical protein
LSHTQPFRTTEEEHFLWQPKVLTAPTPRNNTSWPGLDKDLLSAAREECLEALQNTSEVVGEGVIKMVRGDRQKVCQICGWEFTASRRDAKTCPGGACKQNAYRRRRKEAQQAQ